MVYLASQVSISLGLMGHVSRLDQILDLDGEVHFDEMAIDVMGHGEQITADRVWRATWEHAVDNENTWCVVLQDDALPVPHFRMHAEDALGHAMRTAVSFYVGTGQPRALYVSRAVELADEAGASWLQSDEMLWGVGIAMPTIDIPPYLEWSRRMSDPYDRTIGQWFRRQGRPVQYTWPSLVDHADGPSILDQQGRPPRTVPRRAHRVGVPHWWGGPIVDIPRHGARLS